MTDAELAIKYGGLLAKYLKKELTAEERALLETWLEKDSNRELLQRVSDNSRLQNDLKLFEAVDADAALQKIEKQIQKRSPRQLVRYWWAAAALVAAIVAGVWVYTGKKDAVLPPAMTTIVDEVMPGSDKAILTLGDGRRIVLDSTVNGQLAVQGNTHIQKLKNGELVYTAQTGGMGNVLYNTITTPRGGQYRLTLPDGSRVWLNAASSLRFPAAFPGKERQVELSGEAYFDVAHQAAQSFKVHFRTPAGDTGTVRVLGTQFNLCAYGDDAVSETVLVQGAIRVTRGGKMATLTPGQGAVLGNNGIQLDKTPDIAGITAWKEGYFVFDNTDIETIMRMVARWYDVEVVLGKNVPREGFTGKVPRSLPLSKLMQVLRFYDVRIEAHGKKIIIN